MKRNPKAKPEEERGRVRRIFRWMFIGIGGLLGALIAALAVVVLFAIPIEFDWVKQKIALMLVASAISRAAATMPSVMVERATLRVADISS